MVTTQNMIQPVLVAGLPGCGKTTLIQRLSERWGRQRCRGFFTREIRQSGKRIGFEWETFDGRKGLLADLRTGPPRVGKYHVDLESFERMLMQISKIGKENILLIDEVGKMECLSEKFRTLLPVWENADTVRIFTVPAYGTAFIEAFKSRNQSHTIRLTPNNREELFKRLGPIVNQ